MKYRGFGLVLALALLPAVLAAPAAAEPTREDRAAATALFDEARKLAAAKKYGEACPKFEAAQRLDPGMGTLFNLSDCYEQIGRTASAWSGFRDVASQAKAAGQPDREKAARERATALEPKLSRVRIVVPTELAGTALTITRDGSAVPAALVGSPIPLDPGQHTIRVVAEGREAWEQTITVGTKGGTVDLPVPPLAKIEGQPAGSGTATAAPTATAPGSATASAPPSATASVAPTATAETGSPRSWQKPLGITATIAGALGLGAGIAIGGLAKAKADGADCTVNGENKKICTVDGLAVTNEARGLGDIGTIVGVAGSVVGAAGILLWALAPSAPPPAKSTGVSNVRVLANPGGVTVRGQF